MLHTSTYCARKISRKQFSNGPDGAEECAGNADALLRKASRKLSQLSEFGDFQQRYSASKRCSSTESLALNVPGTQVAAGSVFSSANSSRRSSKDDLTVLDCSNLSLGQLPIELLTEHSEDIEHLILDENELDEQALEDIPRLDKLETLSLNGNQIKNIGVFLQYLKRKCPNLKFLSLIGNPGWPHPILNNNLQLYRNYALSTARLFPSLEFLDTARVSTSLAVAFDDQCPHNGQQQQNSGAKKNGTIADAASPSRTLRASSSASTSLATMANACRLL